MDDHGNLSLADLWYDWPGGRNLHVIRYQLAADAPFYDAEWNNGTSFFYTLARRSCRSAAVVVGILARRRLRLLRLGKGRLHHQLRGRPHQPPRQVGLLHREDYPCHEL